MYSFPTNLAIDLEQMSRPIINKILHYIFFVIFLLKYARTFSYTEDRISETVQNSKAINIYYIRYCCVKASLGRLRTNTIQALTFINRHDLDPV